MQIKKTIFPSNLHAHTFYCDGKNNTEDYILTAIEKGFTSVGLSGHSFTKFDTEYCMSEKGTLEYLKELKNLKKKYEDRIQVYVGIEADFYSGFNPKLDENLGLDFRIGSVHYIKDKEKELNKVSKIINKIFKDKMNKVMKTRDKNKIVEYFSKNDNM